MAADSDSSIEILIKTVLDATGYRMNEAEARKLQQSLGDSAKATEKLGESNKEGAKQAEHSYGEHRKLHLLLKQLGEDSPVVGAALEVAMMGTAGAIMVAIGVIKEFKKEIEETNARFDEMSQIAARPIGGDAWQTIRDAIAESADAAERYKIAMADAAISTNTIKETEQEEIEILKAKTAALKEQLKELEKMELAQHPEDAAAIKAKYEAITRDMDKGEKGSELAAKMAALQAARNAQPGLEAEFEAKRKAAENPDAHLKTVEGFLKDVQQERQQAISERFSDKEKKTREDIEFYQGLLKDAKAAPSWRPGREDAIKESVAMLEELNRSLPENRIKDTQDRIDVLQKQLTEAKNAAAEADHAREEAQSKSVENQKFVTSTEKEVSRDGRVSQAGDAGDTIGRAIEISQRAGRGDKISASESGLIRMVDSLIEGHNVTLQEAEKRFQAAAKNPALLGNLLDRLITVVEQMQPSDRSKLETRIQNLESQVKRVGY